MMEERREEPSKLNISPPGESPLDHRDPEMDAVGWALERVATYMLWIAEHHASFIASRTNDPEEAERELQFLTDSINQGKRYSLRLSQLLLAGHAIEPNKRLPQDMYQLLEKLETRCG